MGIYSVSSSMAGATYGYRANSGLPDWILSKLTELGINPEEVKTLAQAQNLIAEAEQNKQSGNGQNNSRENGSLQVQTSYYSQSAPKNDLRKRLEELAQKVGVSFTDDTKDRQLLDAIRVQLNELFKFAAQKNDENLYKQIEGLKAEFDQIAAQFEDYDKKVKHDPFLDMLAQYNKNALGLN